MSTIDIHAFHELGTERAQEAAEALSGELAEKFQIDYGWDGDCIVFERPGVYEVLCLEYCGVLHHGMVGAFTVTR